MAKRGSSGNLTPGEKVGGTVLFVFYAVVLTFMCGTGTGGMMVGHSAAIGINPTKYKVIAVVIAAIIAGLVGFFYVSYIRYIDPDVMIQSKSTEIVLPAVVGGAAYIEGPLIGGLIMIPLSELLRANFAAVLPGINMLMYAVVLIVVIRFRPSGILGWYMNSKVKTFIDEKILKKPSLDVLEEYELMADKGGK